MRALIYDIYIISDWISKSTKGAKYIDIVKFRY